MKVYYLILIDLEANKTTIHLKFILLNGIKSRLVLGLRK